MHHVSDVKHSVENDIISKQNVQGVGVGYKMVNGKLTNEPAILVFVKEKDCKQNVIIKYSSDNLIPPSIDGIPTDVIECGEIIKHCYKEKVRPIQPGYSCGHSSISAGTIGGIFKDGDGDIVILSNNHVLACENKANNGDYILQPGRSDINNNIIFNGWDAHPEQLDYIATLKRFVQLNENGNNQDSAIAKIHNKFIDGGFINLNYPKVNSPVVGFKSPIIGQSVHKHGRTTGTTHGSIMAVDTKFTIGYDMGPVTFDNCIVLTAMSKPGDSGSIILDDDMYAVGLLFAGSNKVTLANPISSVQSEYGLQILGDFKKPILLQSADWKHVLSNEANFFPIDDGVSLKAYTNCYAYLEKQIDDFKRIEITVQSESDRGATWGPGLTIRFRTGMVKLNVRASGHAGAYFNSNEYNNVQINPNSAYTLVLTKSSDLISGYIVIDGVAVQVLSVPKSEVDDREIFVRVGKTSDLGEPVNYQVAGDIGISRFSNLKIV